MWFNLDDCTPNYSDIHYTYTYTYVTVWFKWSWFGAHLQQCVESRKLFGWCDGWWIDRSACITSDCILAQPISSFSDCDVLSLLNKKHYKIIAKTLCSLKTDPLPARHC